MAHFRLADTERAQQEQARRAVAEALPGWEFVSFYLQRPRDYFLAVVPAGTPDDRQAWTAAIVSIYLPGRAGAESYLGDPFALRRALWMARQEEAGKRHNLPQAEFWFNQAIEDLEAEAGKLERLWIVGGTRESIDLIERDTIGLRAKARQAWRAYEAAREAVEAEIGPEPEG